MNVNHALTDCAIVINTDKLFTCILVQTSRCLYDARLNEARLPLHQSSIQSAVTTACSPYRLHPSCKAARLSLRTHCLKSQYVKTQASTNPALTWV